MIKYILRKILYGSLVLLGVMTLIFFLFQVVPGDPARMMLSEREDTDKLEKVREKYGFNRSISEQYFLYLNDISPISLHENKDCNNYTFLYSDKYNSLSLFHFSDKTLVLKYPYLRESFVKTGKPVFEIVRETFPLTIILAFTSMLFAVTFGIIFGILIALYKDSFLDKFILFVSVIGMSLPSFFASIIIAWFFAYLLHDYTGLSTTSNLFEVDDYGRGEYLNLKGLILPAFTLSIRPLAVIIQLTRNAMIEVLSMDYIRTATSKGLSRFKVLFKHALINTLNPVITVISGWFASLLAGAVFVEYIFGWNGIGKEIVDALTTLDMPVVMGSVIMIASVFVIINILVDILYAKIDPRIKLN